MYPHQAERLTDALERSGADALVATTPANVAYITGFRSLSETLHHPSRFAIFSRQGTALVMPAAEVATMGAEPIEVDHIVCFGGWPGSFAESKTELIRRIQSIVSGRVAGPADALAAALDRLEIRRGSVGMDEAALTHDGWERVTDRLGGIKLVPAAAQLGGARRVKGPYEIESLSEALRVAEEALNAVIQAMDRGMTERDGAALYAAEVVKRGGWPRPAVVAMGDHAAIATPWPTDRALRTGEVVRFDVGCAYRGYQGRLVRTAVLGAPTSAQESAYRAIQAGLEAAIASIVPGAPVGRACQLAQQSVRGNGLPQYEMSELGHGIGLEARESPSLGAHGDATLQMGEVLSVHVAYGEVGWTGVGVMDTVLVTSAGARLLNRAERGLVVLD
jgi:Xaa-Pro dipeptidase